MRIKSPVDPGSRWGSAAVDSDEDAEDVKSSFPPFDPGSRWGSAAVAADEDVEMLLTSRSS